MVLRKPKNNLKISDGLAFGMCNLESNLENPERPTFVSPALAAEADCQDEVAGIRRGGSPEAALMSLVTPRERLGELGAD